MLFKTFAQNKRKFKKFQNNVAQHRENKFKKLSFKTNTLSLNLLYYVSNFIQGIYPGNYPGKLSRELSREFLQRIQGIEQIQQEGNSTVEGELIYTEANYPGKLSKLVQKFSRFTQKSFQRSAELSPEERRAVKPQQMAGKLVKMVF